MNYYWHFTYTLQYFYISRTSQMRSEYLEPEPIQSNVPAIDNYNII